MNNEFNSLKNDIEHMQKSSLGERCGPLASCFLFLGGLFLLEANSMHASSIDVSFRSVA